jgi:hypothetical protein
MTTHFVIGAVAFALAACGDGAGEAANPAGETFAIPLPVPVAPAPPTLAEQVGTHEYTGADGAPRTTVITADGGYITTNGLGETIETGKVTTAGGRLCLTREGGEARC